MQTLTIANQKGGTGKTATALALVQAAAIKGKRALAIDLDPQGNYSFSLGANTNHPGSAELLSGTPAKNLIQHCSGIDVITASWNLGAVTSSTGSARRLSNAISTIKSTYDLIVIDTPPTIGELQFNALQVCTGLIIPLEAEIYALQGLYQIQETASQFKASNPDLTIKGIVFTMYDGRSTYTKQMKETIIDKAAEMGIPYLMDIRKGIAVKEAAALQENLFEYAPKSNPAQDYMKLYEMIERN